MMFRAVYLDKAPTIYVDAPTRMGWRVFANDTDLCGAVNEAVARETAAALNAYRSVHP